MATLSHVIHLAFAWISYVLSFSTMFCFTLFVSSLSNGCGDSSWSSGLVIASPNVSVRHRLIIDSLLLFAFFVQHSLMASEWYKRHFEIGLFHNVSRSLYAMATAILLQILMYFWFATPEYTVWQIQTQCMSFGWWMFVIVHFFTWVLVYGGTLLMDLPELVGLKQAYYACAGLAHPMTYKSPQLCRLYKHARHPDFIALCVVLYFRPLMTLDRLILAISLNVYMIAQFSPDNEDFAYIKFHSARKLNEKV